MKLKEDVRRAKGGDKEALLKLIMDKKAEFYRLAYSYTENKEDAMDAMEDMIVKLYEQIDSLKKEESFYSWSKTILVNCCRNILRKRNKLVEIGEHHLVDRGSEDREDIIDVMAGLKKLNEGQQEAIRLRYLMDMDYESIAEVCSVPVGTVKSRIFNGIAKLKENLGGEY